MKIHEHLLRALRKRTIERRPPDRVIGGDDEPYMHRWYVIPRNKWFNIYFHRFMRSDDDRALHDHPWWNMSFLLQGSYVEHTPTGKTRRDAGAIKFRGAKSAHRIELVTGECWTLFITGRTIREWGFHCPQGWRHWKDFSSKDGNTVGKGCD